MKKTIILSLVMLVSSTAAFAWEGELSASASSPASAPAFFDSTQSCKEAMRIADRDLQLKCNRDSVSDLTPFSSRFYTGRLSAFSWGACQTRENMADKTDRYGRVEYTRTGRIARYVQSYYVTVSASSFCRSVRK